MVVGWDLHRKFSRVSLQQKDDDARIHVVKRARLEHRDRQAMRDWLAGLPAGTPVAMEGAFGWPWVADLLIELGLDPHLGHPPALKVLAKHEPKSDRRDADRLGRFWLQGKFPEAYLAPPDVRRIRERLRYRTALVRLQTGVKNRIHAILHRLGILHDFSDLFGRSGRRWLRSVELPEASREVLEGWLRLLDLLQTLIGQVEKWMGQNLKEDNVVRWLQTIPGVGKVLAHVLRAEIGRLERFDTSRRLVSYAGLAPISDDSADRHGRRHISPACNHTLRWALIEATGSLLSSRNAPKKLLRLYHRLSHGGQTNKGQAKVAVARELCELVYVLWKKGEPYREHAPARPGAPRRARRAAAT
jgi:transposase